MAAKHVVVDGSNIATEGSSVPSLKQLDEAVRAFLAERPHEKWTVVVDATFEHRIDSSEKQMYDEALEAGELITPPAGTIGRGDKFLLEIADRAGATVFSNDSFQEFHGEYAWLFEPGRLIGGKPVPEVGWIFTERTPVRGPRSRMATRAASKQRTRSSSASAAKRTSKRGPGRSKEAAEPESRPAARQPRERGEAAPRRSPRSRGRAASKPEEPVNAPLPFIEFIAEHPLGSRVEGEVVEFSSHGAYVEVGEVRCYVPLKLMGDPAPTKARDVLARNEVREFVVQRLDAPRRGIDLAVPGFERVDELEQIEVEPEEAQPADRAPAGRRRGGAKTEVRATAEAEPGPEQAPAEAEAERPESEAALAEKRATKKAPAKKTAAKKTTDKKAAAKRAPAKKTTDKKAAAKKAPAKKTATKKATAKKAPTKRSSRGG